SRRGSCSRPAPCPWWSSWPAGAWDWPLSRLRYRTGLGFSVSPTRSSGPGLSSPGAAPPQLTPPPGPSSSRRERSDYPGGQCPEQLTRWVVVRIHLRDDQPTEPLPAGELVQARAYLIQGEPGEVRVVGQREQPGVQHVYVEMNQVGDTAAVQVAASPLGFAYRVSPHRGRRGRVQVPGYQLGPLAGVQLGRVEAKQHHLPRPQQRVPGAEPGQP